MKKAIVIWLFVLPAALLVVGCNPNTNRFSVEQTAQIEGQKDQPPGTRPIVANVLVISADGSTLRTEKRSASEAKIPVSAYGASAGTDSASGSGQYSLEQQIREAVKDAVQSAVGSEQSTTDDKEDNSEDGSGQTTDEPIASIKFHHWNPISWDGKGSSMVLCPDDHMDQCWLNGKKLEEHGNTDTGNRQIWTNRTTPRLGGTVTCEQGDKRFVYEVDGSGGLYYGKC